MLNGTRVAITGVGSINALGRGVEAFADGLRAGRCGIKELSLFPASGFRTSRAAQVCEVTPPAWLPPAVRRRAARSALLALVAAREACEMAGLTAIDTNDMGVVIGTTTGGMAAGEEAYRTMLQPGQRKRVLLAWLE